MIFVGDYFAIGLVIVLCMFYFDGKTSVRYISAASKCYVACLGLTVILENFEKTQSVMEELTRDGYRFYLDDFGTGYSNFNCLLQLPFQIIKLDACLLRQGESSRNHYDMVRTLTKLFHDMGLRVVAEGAETQAEVESLVAHGVDCIQGYALARPMPEEALLEFYREHPVAAP